MKNNFEQIRLNIRNRLYNFIGSGSGRCVFDIGNGFDGDDIHREGYKFNDSILESALRLYYTIIFK